MLCHINIHIYFSLITHHVWWIQTSYLPCGFWSCAICSFYSEQRVFEQYSKTSLVSVAEGFSVVFQGAVGLLRVISAIFKNILKTKNTVIFFLNAEILHFSTSRGHPGSAKEVFRKGSSRFCQILRVAVWVDQSPKSHGVVYPWLLTSDGGLPVSVFVL